MVKCISILGHKFRPRYDEIPPSALERIQSETEDGALRFVKAMTEIRPGMSVHLVKMASYDAELKRNGIGLGDIGTVMGASDPLGDDEPLWKVRFTQHDLDKIFWLGRENIEPTSPAVVQIEQPTMREAGFYWLRDDEGWHPAQWDVVCGCGRWWVLGCELPYSDDEFDEIGPRIEVPEGLK